MLTLPDLIQAALSDHDQMLFQQALHRASEDIDDLIRQLKNPSRNRLEDIVRSKNCLLKILEHYFLIKHCEDSESNLPDYSLIMLKNADCVITTNWDSLAERVLMNLEKWSPKDGYGFPIEFETRTFNKKGIKFKKSKTKVLKLHGSIGWYLLNKQVYLRHSLFLQHLNTKNTYTPYYDINSPNVGPDENPILLYPSYLKHLNQPTLLSIWRQASYALQKAKHITFVGYSLPEADSAIRALLNFPRILKIKKTIICPKDRLIEKRWREFFCNQNVEYIEKNSERIFYPLI